MSQYTFGTIDTDTTDGNELATGLEDFEAALQSSNSGTSAPSYAVLGTAWLDTTATPYLLKMSDGTDWITVGALNGSTNTWLPYHGSAALKFIPKASDTGSANAYTVAPSPAIPAYADGQVVFLKPANSNTGSSTLNVSAKGTVNIKMPDGTNPSAGALITTAVHILIYDGTNFILANPAGVARLDTAQTFTKAQRSAQTALTSSGGHIAVDFSASCDFTHTMTENTVLDNPSNVVAGQGGSIHFTQHASSPKTLTVGSFYKTARGTPLALTATNGAFDTVYYKVRSSTFIEISLVPAFA